MIMFAIFQTQSHTVIPRLSGCSIPHCLTLLTQQQQQANDILRQTNEHEQLLCKLEFTVEDATHSENLI